MRFHQESVVVEKICVTFLLGIGFEGEKYFNNLFFVKHLEKQLRTDGVVLIFQPYKVETLLPEIL